MIAGCLCSAGLLCVLAGRAQKNNEDLCDTCPAETLYGTEALKMLWTELITQKPESLGWQSTVSLAPSDARCQAISCLSLTSAWAFCMQMLLQHFKIQASCEISCLSQDASLLRAGSERNSEFAGSVRYEC